MVSSFHRDDLITLARAHRRRKLLSPVGRDFSSNDYLAFAGSQSLRDAAVEAIDRGVAVGSGGSRLLRGNTAEHEALEAQAARFFHSESALFVGSGFAANSLIFATLPQPGDLIVYDTLIHASAHEGMKLSRAPCSSFTHNDVGAAADAIDRWRAAGGKGTPWIAVETLYSMDGDCAPIEDFAALADQVDAILLVDEAHAAGVYGPGGRGLAADFLGRENVVSMVTCGKAFGCEGALILGPAVFRDFLLNRGRSFIFSTAPSPLIASVVRASLGIVARAEDRRERLRALVVEAGRAFERFGFAPSGTQIQPIVIGDEARTMRIAETLQGCGFDVRGIRPPTVPPGTARLRMSITLNSGESDIREFAAALARLL
ncbi:8-amino-7-oxononanoate synthase [Erythrobacter litoralis]|uniref:8-amino-7-oxononanoate synthase n=1 Tax=Erythrobacter litoralis TaxID=39960 RepID=UPI0024351C95|nr:8-amino-7-oxononanoate synthase [Erythrobacter litoralis]MDG6078170.1 8-amino-7-oxononanoate synthase [Erythrobacter litoralis]